MQPVPLDGVALDKDVAAWVITGHAERSHYGHSETTSLLVECNHYGHDPLQHALGQGRLWTTAEVQIVAGAVMGHT